MNKLLVRLIMLFTPLWRSFGVNTEHLRLILEVKLTMDSRRPLMMGMMMQSEKKETTAQDVLLILFTGLMGIMLMIILIFVKPLSLAFSLYFLVWIVFLMFAIISDFTHVLIDPRDNYILFPRPVDDATITLSRILHIGLYLNKMVLALSLPAIIYIPFQYGLAGFLLFLLMILLAITMVIFFVNLAYLLILQLTTPSRFKEVINYFQIVLTVVIFMGYYLFPRLIAFEQLRQVNIFEVSWSLLSPSVWLAGLWEVVFRGSSDKTVMLAAGLSIATPLIGMLLVLKIMARHFSQKLFAISQGVNMEKENGKKGKRVSKTKWWQVIRDRLCRNNLEKAGFDQAWHLTGRMRDFKLRVYPGFAFIPVFFLSVFLSGDGSLQEKWTYIVNSNVHIVFGYICIFAIVSPLNAVAFSEQFKAGWIYRAYPVERPGPLIAGAFKALAVRFYLPVTLVLYLTGFLVWGSKVIDDFLLAFFINLSIGVGVQTADKLRLPFSHPWSELADGANIGSVMTMMLAIGALGSIHFFLLAERWYIILPAIPLSVLLLRSVFRSIESTQWRQL